MCLTLTHEYMFKVTTTTTTTTPAPNSRNRNNPGIVLSPHMCYKNQKDVTVCEVYTKYSKNVEFNVGLKPSVSSAIVNETDNDICTYPVGKYSQMQSVHPLMTSFTADYFHCRMPQEIVKDLKANEDPNCQPVVLCAIYDPYDVNNTNSLLKKSECGYNNISFWLYLIIRSIADIFPAAAVALLSTAIVIATRETSTGRGDVGKQLAAGALGFAIFAPIIGGCADGNLRDAMICFTVLMLLAILILLFDK